MDTLSFSSGKIDKDKCIRCGQCIHNCPFGAIGSQTFIVDVIEALKSGKRVYATRLAQAVLAVIRNRIAGNRTAFTCGADYLNHIAGLPLA